MRQAQRSRIAVKLNKRNHLFMEETNTQKRNFGMIDSKSNSISFHLFIGAMVSLIGTQIGLKLSLNLKYIFA